ncbi:MAG: GAF domain-containing protein [Anaerolineae bacterium]|nr:GAF domain-containing protein [Anaerolineae bacterium]
MSAQDPLRLLHDLTIALSGGRNLVMGLPVALWRIKTVFQADAIALTYRHSDLIDSPLTIGNPLLLLPDDHPTLQHIHRHVNPLFLSAHETANPEASASLLMRLAYGDVPLGHLQIASANAQVNWQVAEHQLFQMAASALGVALLNGEEFRAMQRQSSAFGWLDKFGDSLLNLLSSLRIDHVAERIMMAARDLLEVEEASIMLKDYESDDLILWKNIPAERHLSIRLKPGQGIAGWVLEYGKTATVNDVTQDLRWEPAFDLADGFTTRSIIAVPIFIEDEVVGVVEGINKVAGKFSAEDEVMARALAKWAAIAIGNANAYDELRRTSEQLAEAKKQSAMANMVLSLAHKINNSVGAIRVWAMEARDELATPRAQLAELRYLTESVLNNTEETLLMVRRIRGATELRLGDLQPCSLAETLEAAVQFSRLAPSVVIQRYYEPELPPVGADPERLVEVFLNLVNNAADALGRSGVLTLTCRYAQNGLLEVLVQDNGDGVPEHLRDRIFEPFVSGKQDGLGLGLWMVKLYIELLGGAISMTSSPKGSTFRITLRAWEGQST